MNTVFPRLSTHALISALPPISAYPLFHNVKKAPSPTAPPPLWISAHLFPHFLKWKEYKEKLFLLDCFGLHVRKLEAAATIFKIILVEISALKMFTGKLDLDCSSSPIAFETKLGFFPLLTRRFYFSWHAFCFVYSVLFQFSALMLFASDTCLILTSDYCFSPLFVYSWEEYHILVHDSRVKLTSPPSGFS